MAWKDIVETNGRQVYVSLIGRFASGSLARWGTRTVHDVQGLLDNGLIEQRLLEVSSVADGLPDAHGAPPERISASVTLDNKDGALSRYLVGGPNERTEYSGDSFLNFAGRLVVGAIAPNGDHEKLIVTPTLCLAGDATSADGKITMRLATRDELILGRTKKTIAVRHLREATWIGAGVKRRRSGFQEPVDRDAWDAIRGTLDGNLDQRIPFAYGRQAFPLTVATTETTIGSQCLLGWLSLSEPTIADWHEWRLFTEKWDERTRSIFAKAEAYPEKYAAFTVQIEAILDDPGRTTVTAWLVGFLLDLGSYEDEFFSDQHYVVPTAAARVGLWIHTPNTPVGLLRQLVTDHSELGAAAIHGGSFDRAELATAADHGVCGGTIDSDAPAWEIAQHILGLGFRARVAPGDKLQIFPHAAWSQLEADAAKAGDIPHIWLSDIGRKSWREVLPQAGASVGAAATRVGIQYDSTQEEIWPEPMRRPYAPGAHRLALAQEVEMQISGAWIYPPSADRALRGVSSRRAFATRRFTFFAPLWALSIDVGALVRVSHPLGLGDGGYYLRLGRVERREFSPADMAVKLQIEDLGPVEGIRPGKLDDIANWIAHDPTGTGSQLELTTTPGGAKTSKAAFDPSMVGGSLWVFGAPTEANRRSYRIDKVSSSTGVELSPAPVVAEKVDASPPGTAPIDTAWIVMHSHESKGPIFRPDYIRLADEETGLLPDGSPGYQLME